MISGLPQLFTHRTKGQISISLCTVVDEIIISGATEAVDGFYYALSNIFTVGIIFKNQDVIFNGLPIRKEVNGDIL